MNRGTEYFYSSIICIEPEPVTVDLMRFVWESPKLFGLDQDKGFSKNEYKLMLDWATGLTEALIDRHLNNEESDIMRQAIDESRLRKSRWHPRTNPTAEQKLIMSMATDKIVKMLGVPLIARSIGVSDTTVQNWKARGMFAAWACEPICSIAAVKRMGYTKEALRPDIDIWRLTDEA